MSASRTVQTMCPMNCHPTLCGMRVTVDDGGKIAIEGDPTNPDSQGFLCMRGNAAHEIPGNPARLLHPKLRKTPGQGDWETIGWEAALDLVAQRMREVGREAVGFWQGHGNAANDYGVGLKRSQMERFANLYGCQHWNPAMICWGLGGFGLGLTGALETSTKEDMGTHSNFIVLWGCNTVSQANTIRHVERARARGARVVVIDVRRTELTALADEVLIVRPGTDAALALAMAHLIINESLEDQPFISAHTVGFADLKAHVAELTPEWAQAITGVPAEQICDLARSYATTSPAMVVIGGSSLHKGDNTWAAARAISCLPALIGSFGYPGSGIGPRHGARSHGAGFANITASDRRPSGAYVPNQMEAMIEALEQGTVKVLVSIGSNLLSSFPDTDRMRKALLRAELVVSYDIFDNQTIREASHLVLPGTIWLEEIGAKATNTHVHLCERALEPAGDSRPQFDLLKGLAGRLGVADVYPWKSQEEALNAVLDHPGTGHATVAQMRENGGRAALNISPHAYPTRVFDTPSGKIEFRSDRARQMGLPALPPAPEILPNADGKLRLSHGRTFAHFHAFYDHGRALPTLARREDAPDLWIAPKDADARSLADGDAIRIESDNGSFEARAKVTRRMPEGSVWIRDGWPGLNALTASWAVLPDAALGSFPFSVGQSHFGAEVVVKRQK